MDLTTVDKLLTTTRSVRKRLDLSRPVPREIIEECIEIALQAPSGSNRQRWHFVVVTDEEKRAQIAAYYAKSFRNYRRSSARTALKMAETLSKDDPRLDRAEKVASSAIHLAEHMAEVPVLIIPCIEGRTDQPDDEGNYPGMGAQAGLYGSILPATWSLMLALRSREIGSAWTTLHLAYADEVGELLDIPTSVTQAALLPVAYYTGDDFRPASRVSGRELTYWDSWGETR